MNIMQTLGTLLQLDMTSLAAEVAWTGGGVWDCHSGRVCGTGKMLLEHQLRTMNMVVINQLTLFSMSPAVVPGRIMSLAPVVLVTSLAAPVLALVSQGCGLMTRSTLLPVSTRHWTMVSLVTRVQLTWAQTQVTKHTHHLLWL